MHADEIAGATEGVDPVSVDGGGAARAAAPAVIEDAAEFSRPKFFAGVGIENEEDFGTVAGADGVVISLGDGRAGIALAGVFEEPETFGAVGGPRFEESGFLGYVGAVGAAPLRPVGAGGEGGEGQGGERDERGERAE